MIDFESWNGLQMSQEKSHWIFRSDGDAFGGARVSLRDETEL
jgi:hypothetical protein